MSIKLKIPQGMDAGLTDKAAGENGAGGLIFKKTNPLDYLASEPYRSDTKRYKDFKREIDNIGASEVDAHRLELLLERERLIQGCITGMDSGLLSTLMERIFPVVSAMITVWGAVDVVSSGGLNLIAVLVMSLLMLAYALVEMLWKSHLRVKGIWYQVYLDLLQRRIAEQKP